MNTIEFQRNIARKIIYIKDEKLLDKLNEFVSSLIKSQKVGQKSGTEQDPANYDTFEAWNEYLQSIEYVDLDEFLPEWGMTNYKLRKLIFESEKSGLMSLDEFKND
ncbi:MAG: hypothetical protein K8S16_11370 [Bacteroidales bacterium]|nr:hypothetical protein [Bacteroidales bacterium]